MSRCCETLNESVAFCVFHKWSSIRDGVFGHMVHREQLKLVVLVLIRAVDDDEKCSEVALLGLTRSKHDRRASS